MKFRTVSYVIIPNVEFQKHSDMNEKILQVVGIILSKPSIDAHITILRYSKLFEINLKPRAGRFTSELMQEVVRAFPTKTVFVEENEDFGLHLSITFNESDYEAD